MKKESLTLSDLADKGLKLTKDEATRLLPHVSKISQHGATGHNEVEFEDSINQPRQNQFNEKANLTAEDQLQHNTGEAGVANVKKSTGFSVGEQQEKQGVENENNRLKAEAKSTGKTEEKNDLREDAENEGADLDEQKMEMDKTDIKSNDTPEKIGEKRQEGTEDKAAKAAEKEQKKAAKK